MTDKPSDAEIIMLAVELGVSVRTGKGAVKLARAVLAKWGTPAPVGVEPVAWAATSEDGDVEALGMNQSRRFDTPLYTHPPPPEGMAGWTTLPGQMPEPNTPVLLDIGKKFTIRALWAEKHTVRVGTDVDDWGEYDEETDEYYCPEGWYEWNEHEEVHWAVSETPRAWRELPQPLPAAPGPADGESNG